MHERITLVSDREVKVRRNACGANYITRIVLDCGCLSVCGCHGMDYDALGNEAEILVRQCWRDTGSFAALSDTSAVPFVGKVMRTRNSDQRWVVKSESIYGGMWNAVALDPQPGIAVGCCLCTADLRPLTDPTPPPKKWRAYTLKEAADHCGREFESKENRTYPAKYQTTKRVHSLNSNVVFDYDCKHGICYQSFCNDYVWSDTGEPCGMEVEE